MDHLSTMLIFVLFALFALKCGESTPAKMPVEPYDAIVIGLGAAGTTAASELCKAGKRVLAIEAQDRIGGRVYTKPFGDGVVEVGAEWIHGTHPSRVYDSAIAHNVTVLPQDLTFDVFRSDGTKGDRDLVNELMLHGLEVVDDPPEKAEPLGQFITRRLMDYIRTKHPKLLNDKDFIDQFLKFMDLLIDNYEASTSWNDVSTQTQYEELEGHQHMSWHRYGYKTFFDILLNTYNNGPGFPNLEIKLGTEVTQIAWPQNPTDDVTVTCKDGARYTARHVIVTVSLGVLKERHATLFAPPLPTDKVTSIDNIAMGVIGKVILLFDEVWWSNRTLSCFLWKSDDLKTVGVDWSANIAGVTSPMGSNKVLTAWTGGDITKLVETLPEEEVKTKVMNVLRRFMGKDITIPEPTDMIRSTWYTNPYTRGSYTYDNLLVTKYPNSRAILGQPLVDASGAPRVLFAGEATNLRHFSTVHGAAETGYREAMRLLPQAKL